MTAPTPEQILTDFLADTGQAGRLRRKLAANQHRNWLLALVLHSFTRFAQHAQLSDLEAGIIKAFKQHGYDDAELTRQGQLALQLSNSVRAELFGPEFADLSSATPYTLRQMTADAPGIVKTMLAQPSTTVVDVEGIHAGRARLADVRLPAEEVLKQHASSMTVAVEPQARSTATSAATSTFSIKATKFRCNHRGTDSVFDPKCEYYFIFGSTDGNTSVTTQSKVFNNVDSGDTLTFPSVDGNLWGQSGHAEPLPAGEIGVLVTVAEHDSGDPEQVRAGVAAAFAAASGILIAAGITAWIGAVVAGVGGLITWLIGFTADDIVGDTAFTFNGSLLAKQLSSVGSSIPTERRITDGNDDLTVTITSTHVA